jgi:hypothetical protein
LRPMLLGRAFEGIRIGSNVVGVDSEGKNGLFVKWERRDVFPLFAGVFWGF